MTLLYGGEVVLENECRAGLGVLFDEKIIRVAPESAFRDVPAARVPFKGFLLPGFIDIHLHGAAGADVMDARENSLRAIARALPRTGTTSFLATTMTMEESRIVRALETVRRFMAAPQQGAQCLGAHLEGPFLNPAYAGAQDARHIRPPSLRRVEPWLDIVRVITLAPEMDGAMRFIRELKDRLVLSIGHSGADYETAVRSFRAGVSHVTHCGNAMSGLRQRSPGVVGAALTQDVCVDMITDLIHTHPAFLRLVAERKGPERFLAITDSTRAAGLRDGVYELGGRRVIKEGRAIRLEDGTLAGSAHRMDDAFRNLLGHTRFTLPEVSRTLSLTPARLLKIDHRKGRIRENYDADLVIIENNTVKDVYIGGKKQ